MELVTDFIYFFGSGGEGMGEKSVISIRWNEVALTLIAVNEPGTELNSPILTE